MATQDVTPGAAAGRPGQAARAPSEPDVSPWAWMVAALAVVGATVVWWLIGTSFNDAHGNAAMRLAAAKLGVGVAALALVLAERQGRPVGRRLAATHVQWGGLGLAALALVLYFHGARVDGGGLAHRHEQFHYYMGAKYFSEIGYRRLYLCALVAQDEIGPVHYTNQGGGRSTLDLSHEARDPARVIRRIGEDNLLTPAAPLLAHPERCTQHFSAPRWEAFKTDLLFFRGRFGDARGWALAQMDHGYNPPPVWTMVGRVLANLQPASQGFVGFLASLDLLLVAATLAALRWAFGWRVTCLAAIFLGCNAMAPFGWTGGGFLRQDWLFLLVLSACLMRKQHFGWAGACLAASALLRVFPVLVVLGLLTGLAASAWRHRRWHPADLRALAGGAVASAVLVAASVWVCGLNAYEAFYRHTLVVHDQTPLANHMGLRVLFSQSSVLSDAAGTMKSSVDLAAPDMWHQWKQARLQNYQANRAAMYIVVGLGLVAAVGLAMRRPVPRWAGLCLGSVWMVLMAQLTCYYYTFLLLCAPLALRYPRVELALLGLAVASQVIVLATTWFDVRYTLLSAACVVFCGVLWWIVWGALRRARPHRSALTEAAGLS